MTMTTTDEVDNDDGCGHGGQPNGTHDTGRERCVGEQNAMQASFGHVLYILMLRAMMRLAAMMAMIPMTIMQRMRYTMMNMIMYIMKHTMSTTLMMMMWCIVTMAMLKMLMMYCL